MPNEAQEKPCAQPKVIVLLDNSDVPVAITTLHSNLNNVKSEICKRIEAKISEVTKTLRGEIAKLKAENDTVITAQNAQIDVQNAINKNHHRSFIFLHLCYGGGGVKS